MEYKSFGSTIRNTLLKYAIMHNISTWDYSIWNTLLMTALSSIRMIIFVIFTVFITISSIFYIIVKKRRFTQKDTLCIFIFMVISIFLLDTVENMRKIEIYLDNSYTNIEISMPYSYYLINNTLENENICKFNRKLEKSEDDLKYGEKVSNTYIKLLQQNINNKHNRLINNNILNNRLITTGDRLINGNTTGDRLITTEYCIYNNNNKCNNCILLKDKEFKEVKSNLQYINSINKEYSDIERQLDMSKVEYKVKTVELMKNFKEFNKLTYFIREELETIGVNFNSIEDSIISLIDKYDKVFSGDISNITRIKIFDDSVCVSIKNNEKKPFYKNFYKKKNLPKVKKTSTIIVEEKKTYKPPLMTLKNNIIQEDLSDEITNNIHDMVKSNIKIPTEFLINENFDKSKDSNSPFFISVTYTLIITEILIFIQVLLVMGTLLAIVFDKKWIYMGLYCTMCGSLIFSLILGFVALTNSVIFSYLCENGLKCDLHQPIHTAVTPISNLLDTPDMILRDSINRSTNRLQKQINTVISTNTTEDIENILNQIDRLFQIKSDFKNFISNNPNGNLVNEDSVYNTASKIKSTLNSIKSQDKKVRDNNWTDVFKKLSEINVLLTDTSPNINRRRRERLSELSTGHSTEVSSCTSKEKSICDLKNRFDSLFIGLFFFSVILSVLIAI
ncbi:hypothetical protein NEIG_00245 [Nematocida sp. ERTm5]|nr:hypothetical protein NEIG_00245 [Nematocida sp. ERTm5]